MGAELVHAVNSSDAVASSAMLIIFIIIFPFELVIQKIISENRFFNDKFYLKEYNQINIFFEGN